MVPSPQLSESTGVMCFRTYRLAAGETTSPASNDAMNFT